MATKEVKDTGAVLERPQETPESEKDAPTKDPTNSSRRTSSTEKIAVNLEYDRETDELLLREEVFRSCMRSSRGYINLLILHAQSTTHGLEGNIFYHLYKDTGLITVNFRYTNNTFGSLDYMLYKLLEVESGLHIFYSCLRETQDVCPGHGVLAKEIECIAKERIYMNETLRVEESITPEVDDEGCPVTDDQETRDVQITKEVFLSCISTSRSSINLEILQHHSKSLKEFFEDDVTNDIKKELLFFTQDDGELQYFLYMLCKWKGESNGLQNFYEALHETQNRFYSHGVLAFELEQEAEGTPAFLPTTSVNKSLTADLEFTGRANDNLKELSVTEEVVRSCVNLSRGYINLLILSNLQEDVFKVESDEDDQQDMVCLLHCDVDEDEIGEILDKLQSIQDGFPIFYTCLRETQDVCPGHRILADDIEEAARRCDADRANYSKQSQGVFPTDGIEGEKTIITSEVFLSSIHHHSSGFIDLRIIEEHLERNNQAVKLDDVEEDQVYFAKEEGKLQYILYQFGCVENGLQIFYQSLKETQSHCYWHGVLAKDLEVIAALFQSTATELPSEAPSEATKCPFTYSGIEITYFNPSGILADSIEHKPVRFSVQVVHDDYILPFEYEEMPLVSEMYKITTRGGPLPVPVTVRMEHCAVVEEEDCLIHMIAHGPPPYQFQPLPGGKFPIGESYGEIVLEKFCTLAQYQRHRNPISLSVHLFYHNKATASFVATRNLSKLVQAVKKRYARAIDYKEKSMSCDVRTTSAISLVIPRPPPLGGWMVEPEFEPPKIETRLIRKYREGKTPPLVNLSMRWTGERPAVEERIKIKLEGVSEKSFFLLCSPECKLPPLSPQSYSAQHLVPASPEASPLQTLQAPLSLQRQGPSSVAGASSPEARALRRCNLIFTTDGDPEYLARLLYSKGLLTTEEKERVMDQMPTHSRKLEEIFRCMERRVSTKAHRLHTLIEALSTEAALQGVAEKIQECYEEERRR